MLWTQPQSRLSRRCRPNAKKKTPNAKWKKCWPYQLDRDLVDYEYAEESSVVRNLRGLINGHTRVCLFVGQKTLEYDLAYANHKLPLLVTDACTYDDELRTLAESPSKVEAKLTERLKGDEDLDALIRDLPTEDEMRAARFATCYLMSAEGGKGEHAFELEKNLRQNHSLKPEARSLFQLPSHLRNAIRWACRKPFNEEPA